MRYQEQHQHQLETCSLDVNTKSGQAPTQTLASEEEGGGNTRGRNAFEPPADSAACFSREPLPTAPAPLTIAGGTGTLLFSASTRLLGLNNFNRRTNKGARVTKQFQGQLVKKAFRFWSSIPFSPPKKPPSLRIGSLRRI